MTAKRLWCIAVLAIVAASVLAIATGPTNLTVAAALVATLLSILALVVDGPPPYDPRRPW